MESTILMCIAPLLTLLSMALARRISSGGMRAERTPLLRPEVVERRTVDLRPLLDEMCTFNSEALRAAGVELEQALPDAALNVRGDAGQLRQMLAHIVCIARDAMPDGGVLRSLARTEGSQVAVSFMDSARESGPALLAPTFENALKAWRRPGASHSVAQEHAVASRHIAESHGGRLYAAPSALGGIGLTLRMPLAGVDATKAQPLSPNDG
jgi:two-component system sensor histidine kinase BaeS